MNIAINTLSRFPYVKDFSTTDDQSTYIIQGKSKILKQCSLPLTGARTCSQIITELASFDVDRVNGELTLTDLAEGVTLEEVKAKTDCDFKVAEKLGSY